MIRLQGHQGRRGHGLADISDHPGASLQGVGVGKGIPCQGPAHAKALKWETSGYVGGGGRGSWPMRLEQKCWGQ